tara:strand:+ start:2677 stop:3732 length:1056 start_codon:yes stop_codon:yes gene_type:complete
MHSSIKLIKSKVSKIKSIDFDNFSFGSVFTDHMFECDFIDDEWINPVIKPYKKIELEPSASVFHYGQAVFEGMKAYKDKEDNVWLFRPDQNFSRINKSSERLAIPKFPKDIFFDALKKLVDLERNWIKKGDGKSLYIRPFVIANQYAIQASPSNNYKFMIICAPATLYYTKKLKVLVADKYSRAASGGVGYAKAAGNYAGQFFPTKLAKKQGFDQIIWTDSNEHKYLEEAGTMNVFFRINDSLITAPITDTILDGVTRKSIIQIANDMGIPVEIKKISVNELIDSAKKRDLKEIFGAGTAAVISEIKGFQYKNQYYELSHIDNSYAKILKDELIGIQTNSLPDIHNWRFKI